MVQQPAVSITKASGEEIATCRAEVEEMAARIAKGIYNVCITGATGASAAIVNGMYSPTDEMSGIVMVYEKTGYREMTMLLIGQ